jgi:hypothetical protein
VAIPVTATLATATSIASSAIRPARLLVSIGYGSIE